MQPVRCNRFDIVGPYTPDSLEEIAADLKAHMDKVTRFIPYWVKFAVTLALGLGTMIGWKRIVVTVGEKRST